MEEPKAGLKSTVSALTENYIVTSLSPKIESINDEELVVFNDVNRNNEKESVGTNKRQGFRIGHLNFMVRYEDGSQITEIPTVYPVPNTPNWFQGVCNLQGKIVPVFELKQYFDIEDEQYKDISNQKRQKLFVIAHGEDATGVVIDGLLERLEFDSEQAQTSDLELKQLKNAINACHFINETLWFDLNSSEFLKTMEKSLVNV